MQSLMHVYNISAPIADFAVFLLVGKSCSACAFLDSIDMIEFETWSSAKVVAYRLTFPPHMNTRPRSKYSSEAAQCEKDTEWL